MKASSLASLLVGAALVAGCNRVESEPRVQQVPKQPRPIMAAAQAEGQIDWTVPRGWTPIPAGQMRLAAFQVSDRDPSVLLTVIPLAGESGGLLANVNRWENQLGLPPTAAEDLSKIVKRIEVAGKAVDMVDLTGPSSAGLQQRTLGAILPHDGRTFYFKLTGPADVVQSQKANFDAFIQSIHFDGPGGHGGPPPAQQQTEDAGGGDPPPLPDGHPPVPSGAQVGAAIPPSAQAEELTYTVPQGWVKDEPLPLRVVSFHVGEGDRRIDVIVSKLPAVGTGSYNENITRWRSQVNLPPLAQGEQQISTPLIVGGIDSALFDFVGPGEAPRAKRMLLGWVPKGESWWFFKMIGPSNAVAQQQANFDAFIKSVKFIEPKP